MTPLPPGWVAVRLDDVSELPTRSSAITGVGDLPVLTFKGLKANGEIQLGAPVPSALAAERGMTQVVPGDSVLSAQGHVSGWVGKKVGLVREPAYAASTLQVVRPIESLIDPRLLTHQLSARRTYERLQEMAGARTSLSRRTFLELDIVLPPLNEQRRIVAAIEEQFSRLDAAEESLGSARIRVAQLRATAIERAAPKEAPMVRIGDLVAAGRKLAYGVLQPGEHVEDGVPLVRVGDIEGGSIATSGLKRIAQAVADAYPRTRLRGGEVLLTLVGTIGRTAVVPDSLTDANVARAVGVIPVEADVCARYVAIVLGRPSAMERLGRLAHEVARKTLNLEDVRRFEIPIPSLDEQQRIAADTEHQLSVIEAMHASIEAALGRSTSLRWSILDGAFRGALVPQDQADEPASIALGRNRAERTALSRVRDKAR